MSETTRTNELLAHITELLHELIYLTEQGLVSNPSKTVDCKTCKGDEKKK